MEERNVMDWRVLMTVAALAFVAAVSVLTATTARACANKDIVGCWLKVEQKTQPLKEGQVEPYLEYCFRDDGRILGVYMESGGYGGDLEMKWRRIGRSILKLDADRCTFKYIDNDHFALTNCMHESEWKLACRHPKYPGTCGNIGKN
jgi:hypothetical protein